MLTMEEIENISFRRAGIGGYKIEDVDTFVDGVIEKVRELELANKELQARIEQLNKQIIKHEAQADSVQDAIITAEITAKKLVRDAQAKADSILSSANENASVVVAEAEDRASSTISEADIKAQTILNSALMRSASSIDENNRIIEHQKQHIIRIQAEVTRFREALIDSYKNHLKLINSLPREDEFRQYQEKMDETYPIATPVTPDAVEQEIKNEADKAVEDAKKEMPQIKVEMVDAERVKAISEEIRTNSKAQEALNREQQEDNASSYVEEEVSFLKSPKIYDLDKETAESERVSMDNKSAVDGTPDLDATQEIETENIRKPLAAEELTDISAAEEADDINAEEIRAAVSADTAIKEQSEEPKPLSIDEIDDGVIFSSGTAEEQSRSNNQNNRQPIRVDNADADGTDGHSDDIKLDIRKEK